MRVELPPVLTPPKEAKMAFQRLFMVSLLIAVSSLLTIRTRFGHVGDETPSLNSLSDADLKTLTIRLERIGCFGTCPAYTVAIHGDGRIEYDGKSHVKQVGVREG